MTNAAEAEAAAAATGPSPLGQWPWKLPDSPDPSLWSAQGEELERLCLVERQTHARLKNLRSLHTPEIQGDLGRAAAELLKPQCKTIAILVGSCTNTNMWPPTDTDGPGGACALAAALWRLHKRVIIPANLNRGALSPLVERREKRRGNFATRVHTKEDSAFQLQAQYLVADEVNAPQVVPAVEASLVWALHRQATEECDKVSRPSGLRPGRGKEGEYWSPSLTSTTLWQADFSLLFEWAAEPNVAQKTTTTTIGCLGTPNLTPKLELPSKETATCRYCLSCRGRPPQPKHLSPSYKINAAHPLAVKLVQHTPRNELGMGRIKEAVKENVEDGEWLANDAPADYTIIATTANYGAYGLTTIYEFKPRLSKPHAAAEAVTERPQQRFCIWALGVTAAPAVPEAAAL
ncbi:uncharacterized protein LOC34621043 [Cyclospora cayetanensis]|uniref:Uncharacterized protein LOC34621043 n=1 Tax=Cyclospora cayetanensis TaxID=88456 RepID=A0A6P6RT65_9EIME|nr:uncharacterized protein LOC34621043 [Cyclospora cayetanensis]